MNIKPSSFFICNYYSTKIDTQIQTRQFIIVAESIVTILQPYL